MTAARSGYLCFGAIALTVIGLALWGHRDTVAETPKETGRRADATASRTPPVVIVLSPHKPADLPALGNRRQHTLTEASTFAWQQFIAHTWPAKTQDGSFNCRGEPDTSLHYGQKGKTGQVVWETYRHKVELFPGKGQPNGYVNDASKDYGYDALPSYVYAGGEIPPADGKPSKDTPFDNLDEVNQILLCDMSAGISSSRILYQAKANRVIYKYVARHGLFDQGEDSPGQMRANAAYNVHQDREADFRYPYIKLPSSDPSKGEVGSIEIKSAWRKLGASEDKRRFFTNRIRFYVGKGEENKKYREEEWGLVALHIIHKTESSPAFVYTSFSQIDNIRDKDGVVVEEPDGLIKPEYRNIPPFNPELIIRKSTLTRGQEVEVVANSPGLPKDSKQLFFQNIGDFKHGVTVPVGIRRRLFEISSEVRAVNRIAQAAIREYDKDSVWQYYKLVNVQSTTLPSFVDRSEIDDLSEDIKASFFMANEVVETNVPLQQFSGTLSPGDSAQRPHFEHAGNYDFALFRKPGRYEAGEKISSALEIGQPVFNTYLRLSDGGARAWHKVNMGGCMGCHGPQGQLVGGDFSVIVARGRVHVPESTEDDGKGSNRLLEYNEAQKKEK